ncbi:MAG: lipopolysaccharide biosynthesis protein, partial [Anaerolineae bacterium]|nr:lipopolysaccharide biosynthesis protein [Anaerolineae bacterium]
MLNSETITSALEPVARLLLVVLLAAAIGLLLSAGAAFLLEYLDDTLKSPDDVQSVLGITALGAVPRLE